MASINQIAFPSSVAAVRKDAHLRVYETGVNGAIREAQYEGGWTGGQDNNIIATGKIGTPVAATSIGLSNIRVYYVDNSNTAKEACWDGNGWYTGAFKFPVADYSSISAVFLGGRLVLRVYGQLSDNTIKEWCWDEDGKGWKDGTNFGRALPGTAIAATTWSKSIRVYFQDESNNVIEKCWDGNGWYVGAMKLASQVPRTTLGVTSWGEGSSLGIRLYYATRQNVIKEKAWDGGGGWYDGAFSQDCLPGSRVAAIPLPILRVYMQNGTKNSAVTEFMWNNGWSVGHAALPPA